MFARMNFKFKTANSGTRKKTYSKIKTHTIYKESQFLNSFQPNFRSLGCQSGELNANGQISETSSISSIQRGLWVNTAGNQNKQHLARNYYVLECLLHLL